MPARISRIAETIVTCQVTRTFLGKALEAARIYLDTRFAVCKARTMEEAALARLTGYQLHGGFRIVRVSVTDQPLLDAIGREAVARTVIIGSSFEIELARLSDDELSISLYHEVLEAATVAAATPPASVAAYNEPTSNAQHATHARSSARPLPRTSTACCNRSASVNNDRMAADDQTQLDLIKLADGVRLLRFTDPKSGVSVERRVDVVGSVAEQKRHLREVFDAAVARAQLAFA